MANLPCTDGSNGNGIHAQWAFMNTRCVWIQSAIDLVKYVEKYPIALHDDGFMMSYIPLMKSHPDEKKNIC